MELIENYPVAILGAGPVGLAAAANLIEYGLTPLVFEADAAVAASFRDFSHVKLFSPWRYNIDRAGRRLLEDTGWSSPDADAIPTAGELLRDYLEPLAALPAIADNLKLGSRVIAVARRGCDKVKSEGRERAPFVIRVEQGGEIREYLAGAVLDATGNWSRPNPLGANGLPAIGEVRLASRIRYGMPDIAGDLRSRYLGKTTLVGRRPFGGGFAGRLVGTGGGRSGHHAALGLARLQSGARLSLSGAKSRVQRGREKLRAIVLDCCHVESDADGLACKQKPDGARYC